MNVGCSDVGYAGEPMIEVRSLAKTFTLHIQGGVQLPVFAGLDLTVHAGECVVLSGPSGSGKSTVLRSLYANYKPSAGTIRIRHGSRWVELSAAPAREVLALRRAAIGYVSQFLRVIPRVTSLDVVAGPLLEQGCPVDQARDQARRMLRRLNVAQRLWSVPPATFSGGEQQRVNIARSLVRDYPVLLLDEPTASLDPDNCSVVIELINEARTRGSAIVGIFHDARVREAVSARVFDVTQYAPAA